MSLTPQERTRVESLAADGYDSQQIKAFIGAERTGRKSSIHFDQQKQLAQEEDLVRQPLSNRIADAVGLGGATDVFGDVLARQGIGTDVSTDITQEFIEAPSGKQIGGALAQTATVPLGFALTGGTSLAGQVAAGAGIGYLYDIGSDLLDEEDVQTMLTPGFGTVVGAAAPPVLRGASQAVGAAIPRAAQGARAATEATTEAASTATEGVRRSVQNTGAYRGATQLGKEFLTRFPRAFNRARNAAIEAGERAQRLENARPQVKQAYELGLDEVLIEGIEESDDVTRNAFREMVEIAESSPTGLRPQEQPRIVAGRAASEQYKLLNNKRKEIGQQIGDAVESLSKKKGRVSIQPAMRQVNDLLRKNGITPMRNGNLRFDATEFSEQQENQIRNLYKQANKGGMELTPSQIHGLDRLFGSLEREAKFAEGGTVMLRGTNGESLSIYRAMRNIFTHELERVAPNIKPLNAEYVTYRNLIDDIENSIVKSGNFSGSSDVDPAQFAQTNLRRIFSNAQSAADYDAIYNRMDTGARDLGYTGPRADDLANFGNKLNAIYPETVRANSFQGGIQGAVSGLLDRVIDFGSPQLTDQQKALRALLGIDDAAPTPSAGAGAAAEDVVDDTTPPAGGAAAEEVTPAATTPEELFEESVDDRTLFQRIRDTFREERGSVSLTGDTEQSRVGRQRGSSVDTSTLSDRGREVLNKFLRHVDGTERLQGEEKVNVFADAQVIAERAGLENWSAGEKALANELADRYGQFID